MSEKTLDIQKIRKDFPLLSQQMRGKSLVFLDSGATSQKPNAVIDSVSDFYRKENSNVHRGIYELSERASDAYEKARATIAESLGAKTSEIIFTRGTTESINLVASSLGQKIVQDGSSVAVTRMEHHSNFVPWQQLAKRKGAEFQIIELTDDGRIDPDSLDKVLSKRPKVLALTWVSNVLGTINPVEEIASKAKQAGAIAVLDCAQGVIHGKIDLTQWPSVDFVAFSAHKMCGPTGVGVLWGRKEMLNQMDPYQYGGNMILQVGDQETTFAKAPARFEAGTPDISGAIGFGAAFEYLSGVGWDAIGAYDRQLTEEGLKILLDLPGLKLFGPQTSEMRSPVFSFALEGIHPHDIATLMDQEGVAIRAGHHCAQPLNRSLGVSATTRASFAFYNSLEEIEKLAAAIRKCQKFFGKG